MRALPASLDYADIKVRSSARLFGTDMSDPGLLQVTATVSIYDSPDDNDAPVAGIEGIGLDVITLGNGDTEIVILRAEGLVLDLHRIENAYDILDARSQELEAYGCLLDLGGNGGLHPELESMLESPFSQHLVIAERVRVAPAWRGAGGVGRYLAARLLPCVCAQPAVVATEPFPLDVPRDESGEADDAVTGPALRQVERTWKSIGFQPYKNGIWIMDPGLSKHERAVARLERSLGLQHPA
jgi:hypothetical protein